MPPPPPSYLLEDSSVGDGFVGVAYTGDPPDGFQEGAGRQVAPRRRGVRSITSKKQETVIKRQHIDLYLSPTLDTHKSFNIEFIKC